MRLNDREALANSSAGAGSRARTPNFRLLYETAPVGLAFLTTDCRYELINRHLCEICGLSVDDHIGRSVRETVPQLLPAAAADLSLEPQALASRAQLMSVPI